VVILLGIIDLIVASLVVTGKVLGTVVYLITASMISMIFMGLAYRAEELLELHQSLNKRSTWLFFGLSFALMSYSFINHVTVAFFLSVFVGLIIIHAIILKDFSEAIEGE